jgi:hypothetical protein
MYNMVRLLLELIIKDFTLSKAELISGRKRLDNSREPCRRPELNILEYYFWLLKENASFESVVKELV